MDEQTGFDPKRRLCPEGTCTGIIGRDGRCGECGRTASGTKNGAAPSEIDSVVGDPPTTEGGDDNADSGNDVPTTAATGGADSGFDSNRRLCGDGACVGVVGTDGACTVCGRVAS